MTALDTRWRDDRMTGRRSHGRLSPSMELCTKAMVADVPTSRQQPEHHGLSDATRGLASQRVEVRLGCKETALG